MLLAVAISYAKLGDRATASVIFDQAIQAAMAIDDRLKVYTVEAIAAAQIDAQDHKAALATIRRAFRSDREGPRPTRTKQHPHVHRQDFRTSRRWTRRSESSATYRPQACTARAPWLIRSAA